MPAEFESEVNDSSTLENPIFLLQDAHLTRLAQWADSWVESFRSDSSQSGVAEPLPTDAGQDKSATLNPNTPPTLAL